MVIGAQRQAGTWQAACAAAHHFRSLLWARQSSGWPASVQRHGRLAQVRPPVLQQGTVWQPPCCVGWNSSRPCPCPQARRCAASSMEHRSLIRWRCAGGLEAPDPNNTRPTLRSKLAATQDEPAGTGSLPAAALRERGGRAPASQPLQQRCGAGSSSRPAICSDGVPAQSGAPEPASQAPPRSQRRGSGGTAAAPAGGRGGRGTGAPGDHGAQGSERRGTAGAAAVHTARPPQSGGRRGRGPARLLAPHGTSRLPQKFTVSALLPSRRPALGGGGLPPRSSTSRLWRLRLVPARTRV